MRLSEKTIELTYCAQFAQLFAAPTVWFGLTQRQEAQWGFDACTKLNARLLVFQFKASAHVLKGGARRFHLDHSQLTTLMALVGKNQRSVFYVFPQMGSTKELATAKGQLLKNTWLLDVATIPCLKAPTTKKGKLRKTGIHYADVAGKKVTIHSDPVEVELISGAEFAEDARGADGLSASFIHGAGDTVNARSRWNVFGKSAAGVLVPKPAALAEIRKHQGKSK